MGMDKTVNITHYLELEEPIDKGLESDLYGNFVDKFYIPNGLNNIIISNFTSSFLKISDENSEVKEINSDTIESLYSSFMKDVAPIIELLNNKQYKYKIKFGLIQYYS